jgi:hypothetical protein
MGLAENTLRLVLQVCKQKISLKGFERNLPHSVYHRRIGNQLACGILARVTLIRASRILAPLVLRSKQRSPQLFAILLQAMKSTSAIAFILLSARLFGQSPLSFDVANVMVGSKGIATTTLNAVGRWSPDEESMGSSFLGPMSAEVRCFKTFGFCERIGAIVTSGSSSATVLVVQDFDVVRWDDKEILAVDDTAPCVTNTLRVNFGAKTVEQSRALKTSVKDRSCRKFSHIDEWTTFLVGIDGGKKRN